MELKILVWNIRGATHAFKKNFFETLCKRYKPDVLCLIEPMMQIQEQYYLRLLNFYSVQVNNSNKIWFLLPTTSKWKQF